jgi:carboxylesterase type B
LILVVLIVISLLLQVMIFGESAGAMSVGYQMMYEDGNTGGVFRAALMQSGSPSTWVKCLLIQHQTMT